MTFSNIKFGILFAAIGALTAPQLASAQSAAPLSGFYACEALTTQDAQLSCFLAETAKLRAGDVSGDVLPAAPLPSASLAAPPAVSVGNLVAEKESLAVQQQSLAAEKEQLALEKTRLKVEQKRVAALEKNVEAKANPPKERTVAIVGTSKVGLANYVRFTLENGEVWQQKESGRFRLGKGSSNTLTIKRGALGSTRAKVNDKGRLIAVKQIK